jgi:hypothetical protein
MSHHVFADGRFGNLDAQFQQLAVNAWRTPARVVAAHHPNQIPDLLRHLGPTPFTALYFPRPEQTEALPVPGDDRLGLDNHQGGFPIAPYTPQPDPGELLPQRDIFQPYLCRRFEQPCDGTEQR